ncbi:MAG TPA: LysR family transcriptional regulator [Streptosporangiaceae bacterium]|jgi:DNA-binding transcriptional LysR family regulator
MSGLRGTDLNLLVALGALLEERNLTRAGERINMSQPAMSAALARLRKHFDDELMVRVGRGYELTPLAARTLPLAQQALRQAEAALEVPPDFSPATSTRQLSISISDYAMTVMLAPLLELLRRRAPFIGVEVDPLPRDSDNTESYLQRRDLLIGGLGLGIPGRRQVVFRDRFVCIADRHNPRVARGSLTLDEVAGMRHAATNFGRGTVTPPERALLRHGIKPDNAVIVPGLLPIPFAVAGTRLIAFVPERLARRCAGPLGLVIVGVDWEPPELVEAAHWHPGRSADPTLPWLRGILREVSSALESAPADHEGLSA